MHELLLAGSPLSAQVNNFTKQEKFLVCQWQAKKNFVTWYTDCSSFYLLKYCLVICRILGTLQITYFTLIPDLEFLFQRKTLALRPDLALERIALNVSAAISETNEFPCTVHWIVQSFSGVGVTAKSMFHLLIFVIFIGVLGVLIFDFLSRKKTEINGAHVLVRFPVFFSGGKFRALHVTTASLQFCCYFFRLLADQVVLEKRWPLRWLSVELTWLSWRGIWLELPEWSWYRAVTVYKVHLSHTAVRGV